MWVGVAPAQDNAHQPTKEQIKSLLESLQWKTGSIPVGADKATLNLQSGYRYLNAGDTNKVLSTLWGNPPSSTWGLIVPPDSNPLNYPWAMLVERFEEEGYVKDADADKLDADKLLSEMQEGQRESNEASGRERLRPIGDCRLGSETPLRQRGQKTYLGHRLSRLSAPRNTTSTITCASWADADSWC